MESENITKRIIGCAFKVHNTLGSGFLEKVYENALCFEINQIGLKVIQQFPITVYYHNQNIGEYYADLLVNDNIIVEIKAVESIVPVYEVQLVNYLNATKKDIGLLINFGSSVEVKRKYRNYR